MPSRRKIKVLAATENRQVIEHLAGRNDVDFDIALYTGSVRDLLKGTDLLILDQPDLVSQPIEVVDLLALVAEAKKDYCSSDQFLANPERYLGELVTNRAGQMLAFPQTYCIAFVSCSGGTGCTTLAMDTAMQYAKAREDVQPAVGQLDDGPKYDAKAALFEVSYGSSSFVALTGVEMPQLYRLATDTDAEPLEFKGVDMYPMDYQNIRVLTAEHTGSYFRRAVLGHGLTVIDAVWPHEHLVAIHKHVNLWIVVASDDREDTKANARHLREALIHLLQWPPKNKGDKSGETGEGDEDNRRETKPAMTPEEAERRVWTLVNRAQRKRGQQQDDEYNLVVEQVNGADDLRGVMGQVVLEGVFNPLWEEESNSRSSGFFG